MSTYAPTNQLHFKIIIGNHYIAAHNILHPNTLQISSYTEPLQRKSSSPAMPEITISMFYFTWRKPCDASLVRYSEQETEVIRTLFSNKNRIIMTTPQYPAYL